MKKKALVAAVLAATTLTATPAFAAQNPFKDMPKDHWAYDAVNMLVKDGVVEGYGDGTFGGDKLMNRYEMAEIVAKAAQKYGSAEMKDKGAIKKLQREFASELKDMDARLAGVEQDVAQLKKGQSSFKWFGDVRLRYFENQQNKLYKGEAYRAAGERNSKFDKRVRLGMYGEPAKNLYIEGRLKYEDNSFVHDGWSTTNNQNFDTWDNSTKNQKNFRLDKMSLNWNHAGTKVSVGRTELNLGQGLLWWENCVDGAYIQHQFGPKLSALVGWGDISAEGWQAQNMPSIFSNVALKASPATTFTFANMHTNTALSTASTSSTVEQAWTQHTDGSWHQDGAFSVKENTTWTPTDYKLNQYAVGFSSQLAPKWLINMEGVRNNVGLAGAQKDGFWTRLTYGRQIWSKANTWQVYAEYLAAGNCAVDSSYWGHHLNVAGGDGFNGHGERGWGLGASYMLAANTNLEFTYYHMRPYDTSNFGGKRYDNMGYGAFIFSF